MTESTEVPKKCYTCQSTDKKLRRRPGDIHPDLPIIMQCEKCFWADNTPF